MTRHDWDNLQFLLNASPETLCHWYDNVEVDDHEYASDLLALYGEELRIKSILLADDVPNINDAVSTLRNYRL